MVRSYPFLIFVGLALLTLSYGYRLSPKMASPGGSGELSLEESTDHNSARTPAQVAPKTLQPQASAGSSEPLEIEEIDAEPATNPPDARPVSLVNSAPGSH